MRDFDYNKEAEIVNNEKSIKTKLQDSLVVLPKVNASTELILLVKARLKKIREDGTEFWYARELSEVCVHPNNLLYGLNKLLSDYRGYILKKVVDRLLY